MASRMAIQAFFFGLLFSGPFSASGEEISISPKDPASVYRGIMEAYGSGKRSVTIPPGVYQLPVQKGSSGVWHLPLKNLRDFTIEATGATLVHSGRGKPGILFENCQNVTLRGATITRNVLTASQGVVEALNLAEGWLDIRVSPGYPADFDNPEFAWRVPVVNIYDATSRRVRAGVPDLYTQKVQRLGSNLFRFYCATKIEERFAIKAGDKAAWRAGKALEIAVRWCESVRIEKVLIKGASGQAVNEQCGEGRNYYNFTVTYGPTPEGATEPPLVSASADAFMSGNMRHGPTLENCLFEGMNDDGVNIHGQYALIMELREDRMIVDARHPWSVSTETTARTGDLLRFYDQKGTRTGEARVVSIRDIPEFSTSVTRIDGPPGSPALSFSDPSRAIYREIVLDRKPMGVAGGWMANADLLGNGFIIRNVTIRNNRNHGMLVRAGGIIENCHIEGTPMGAIVVLPEFDRFHEGDYVQGLVIQNNTMRETGFATQPTNAVITLTSHSHGKFIDYAGHKNIAIKGNTFIDNQGPHIMLTSAEDVVISNNRFIRPMGQPPFLPSAGSNSSSITNRNALVWLRMAGNVRISGNRILEPGRYLKEVVDMDGTVDAPEAASGFETRD